MDFFVSGILSRIDDALFAILVTFAIQFLIMIVTFISSKSFNPAPIVEILLRPMAIFLSDKLNRAGRSDFALIIRGSIVFFLILATISLVGIGLELGLVYLQFGAYMDVILLSLLLSPISVLLPAYAISHVKPRKGSYRHIAQALNQNLIISDDFGLRRASIHAMSLSLNEWLVAPILFYLLGGMPLACLFIALRLFVRIDTGERSAFHSVYAFLYRIFTQIAAVFSFLLILASSLFSSGGRPVKVLKSFRKDGLNVLSLFAYAQNLTLGGSVQNRIGQKISKPWVGPENTSAKILRRDVIRVIIQYCISLFLLISALLMTYFFM